LGLERGDAESRLDFKYGLLWAFATTSKPFADSFCLRSAWGLAPSDIRSPVFPDLKGEGDIPSLFHPLNDLPLAGDPTFGEGGTESFTFDFKNGLGGFFGEICFCRLMISSSLGVLGAFFFSGNSLAPTLAKRGLSLVLALGFTCALAFGEDPFVSRSDDS
jgi:hypothetical protein